MQEPRRPQPLQAQHAGSAAVPPGTSSKLLHEQVLQHDSNYFKLHLSGSGGQAKVYRAGLQATAPADEVAAVLAAAVGCTPGEVLHFLKQELPSVVYKIYKEGKEPTQEQESIAADLTAAVLQSADAAAKGERLGMRGCSLSGSVRWGLSRTNLAALRRAELFGSLLC